MSRACSRHGEKKDACRILVIIPEGKTQLAGPRRGWIDNIKMNATQIGWGCMVWLDVC
jgi:hypothetical protein